MRIAVLSDVHAVAATFEAALGAAREEGYDVLLILGDLLTYGADPQRSLDLALTAAERDGALLIKGNHDQLYFDAAAGGSPYLDRLPDWIRESVDWTIARLPGRTPPWGLEWLEEWQWDGLLAAHANPFGYGDWTYLTSPESCEAACEALRGRGFDHGIFGHSHRFRLHESAAAGAAVATVGSLGQPREAGAPVSQWAMVELDESGWRVAQRPLDCDWAQQIEAIRATTMSEDTKERLCRFYR